jgi:putative heme-binding domain-containing protein
MKVKRSYVLDARMPFDEKRRSARDMARDVIGSSMILSLVATGKFPKDLYDEVSELMLNHPDQTIRIQASQYFSSGAGHSYDIPSVAAFSSDPAKGKLIFTSKCSSCHRVGDIGMDIGPELTQIKKKFDKQALMDAIVNPSSGIVFGYEAWTIQTNDGQSHFGFLVADGKEAVVVKDLSGTRHAIQAKDILSRQKSEKSLMPEASGLALNDQELADVVGFLNSLK